VRNFLESTGAKPVIDKVFPLAQAAMAQQRLAASQHFGKIVLRIDG
jgi:NADPH:quinone reductase-like Zn-dependent oxidoreductase